MTYFKPNHIKIIKRLCAYLLPLILALILFAFFTNETFFEWAFKRHQNVLSWWIRPLMLIPFALAAWFRSWPFIWLSLIALFTSMFWFPAPDIPDAKVMEFLAMEKQLLSAGWNVQNIFGALGVCLYGILLGAAIWHRSILLTIAAILCGGLLKIIWSVIFSPQAGTSILPMAVAGTIFAAIIIGFVISKFKTATARQKIND